MWTKRWRKNRMVEAKNVTFGSKLDNWHSRSRGEGDVGFFSRLTSGLFILWSLCTSKWRSEYGKIITSISGLLHCPQENKSFIEACVVIAIEPFGHVWLFFDRRAFKSRVCLGSSTSRARLEGTERDFYWLSANAWNCVSTCTLSRCWEKRSQTAWQAVFSGMEIPLWADNKVA